MALLTQFLVAFGTACGRGAHYRVEAARALPQRVLRARRTPAQGTQGLIWGHVAECSPTPTQGSSAGCLACGLSSGEGLIAEVRDPIDDTDTDAPPTSDGSCSSRSSRRC